MNITIFGGSAPKPNSPAYNDILMLGKLLAERRHSVMTGGYIGTMEAVSRGASEAGDHVIGVVCGRNDAADKFNLSFPSQAELGNHPRRSSRVYKGIFPRGILRRSIQEVSNRLIGPLVRCLD